MPDSGRALHQPCSHQFSKLRSVKICPGHHKSIAYSRPTTKHLPQSRGLPVRLSRSDIITGKMGWEKLDQVRDEGLGGLSRQGSDGGRATRCKLSSCCREDCGHRVFIQINCKISWLTTREPVYKDRGKGVCCQRAMGAGNESGT